MFENSDLFCNKLDTSDWLTGDQRQRLSKICYLGWGQVSTTLLYGIRDSKGKTVIDHLWNLRITSLARLRCFWFFSIQSVNGPKYTKSRISQRLSGYGDILLEKQEIQLVENAARRLTSNVVEEDTNKWFKNQYAEKRKEVNPNRCFQDNCGNHKNYESKHVSKWVR
ncbi:CRISPR-associated endonuclease Cas9 REC1/REC2 domain-containing protein [Schleiferilactobacillus shenzhenensis]|uniref:CRISPR-associated endonuclease Cas9 REC lobe domain-containing protein n=1 Tax=Schleiferilactobacillus shenzhenensis LY-73 TaxID=1231336 RepID=U4THX6_9LACO|nr:CRISPR-associated endonuclease Cas9 REC1/REC2 domain-containing protein [Schleiferilactobacillus shenzhenensis]ERL64381.1 hypothetical protein L248_1043 [Schleiferilactobacillus shenzhenensis LY-73]